MAFLGVYTAKMLKNECQSLVSISEQNKDLKLSGARNVGGDSDYMAITYVALSRFKVVAGRGCSMGRSGVVVEFKHAATKKSMF